MQFNASRKTGSASIELRPLSRMTTCISPGPSTGRVKKYNAKQTPFGGYITDDHSGQDIYVHKSALAESGFAELAQGQKVAFDIVADSFGSFKAVKVRACP